MFYVLSHLFHTDPEFDTLDAAIAFASDCDDASVEIYRLTDDGSYGGVVWPSPSL